MISFFSLLFIMFILRMDNRTYTCLLKDRAFFKTNSNVGFKQTDFDKLEIALKTKEINFERIHLNLLLPADMRDQSEFAELFIIPNGIEMLTSKAAKDEIFTFLNDCEFDEQGYHYGKLRKKYSEQSLEFANDIERKSNLAQKISTIVDVKKIPHVVAIRKQLAEMMDKPNIENGIGEVNRYLNTDKNPNQCGVGPRGYAQCREVIAFRLGHEMKFSYQWFFKCLPIGQRFERILLGGTIYLMSKKAVGYDYKLRKILTLRHFAGSGKFSPTSKTLQEKYKLKHSKKQKNEDSNTKQKKEVSDEREKQKKEDSDETETDDETYKRRKYLQDLNIDFKTCFVPRRAREDRYFIDPHFFMDQFALFIVCDGHANPQTFGSKNYPHVVDEVIKLLPSTLTKNLNENVPDILFALHQTFIEVDTMIHRNCHEFDGGSTCCLVLIEKKTKKIYNANIGDSRLILCDSKYNIIFESQDHTFSKDNSRIDLNLQTKQQDNYVSAHSSCYSINVSRAFGDFALKETSTMKYDGINGCISIEPTISIIQLKEEETYLYLTTDGPFDALSKLSSQDFIALAKGKNPQEVANLIAQRTSDDLTMIFATLH